MKYYYFCWQYKDYFEIVDAKIHKCVPFAISFFYEKINFRSQHHNFQTESDNAAFFTWDKFKTFLTTNLERSVVFVDNIWSKMKRDSSYQ